MSCNFEVWVLLSVILLSSFVKEMFATTYVGFGHMFRSTLHSDVVYVVCFCHSCSLALMLNYVCASSFVKLLVLHM